MSFIQRRAPYFDQPRDWDVAPPAEAVPPLIAFRSRILAELYVEPLPILPQYYRFVPFITVEAPANPVIAFQYGRPTVFSTDAVVLPKDQRFVPFSPTNRLITFRYGRDVLQVDLKTLGQAAYQRFPFAPSVRATIQFRYGKDILRDPVPFIAARYQAFPYVSAAVVAPANPVLGFRYGQPRLEAAQAFVDPHFHRFPYLSPTAPAVLTKCWEFRMADNGTLTWVEVPCLPCLPVDDTDDCGGGAPSGPVGVC